MGKPLAELRGEMEDRCARAESAPKPAEIARRAAMQLARLREAAGVHAILDDLEVVREVGEFTQYAAVVRLSRHVTRAELEQALRRGLTRSVPGSDSERE